jgi:hypothetical protein
VKKFTVVGVTVNGNPMTIAVIRGHHKFWKMTQRHQAYQSRATGVHVEFWVRQDEWASADDAAEADAEIAEEIIDAADARAARASIEDGAPLIPWEQIKAEAGLDGKDTP